MSPEERPLEVLRAELFQLYRQDRFTWHQAEDTVTLPYGRQGLLFVFGNGRGAVVVHHGGTRYDLVLVESYGGSHFSVDDLDIWPEDDLTLISIREMAVKLDQIAALVATDRVRAERKAAREARQAVSA